MAVSKPERILAAINAFQETASDDDRAFAQLARALQEFGLTWPHAERMLRFQLGHSRADCYRDRWFAELALLILEKDGAATFDRKTRASG